MSKVIKTLTEAYVSERQLPKNFKKKDLEIFNNESQRNIASASLVSLENATFLADGLVYVNGNLLPDTLGYEIVRKKVEFRAWLKAKMLYKKVKADGKPLVVHNYYWNGYFHWMTEILPKLYTVKELSDDYTLVMPEMQASYQKESFQALGFEKVQFLKKNTLIKPKALYFIENLANSGNYNKHAMEGLVEFLKSKNGLQKDSPAERKIYVSRKKANKRKILNESELEKDLRRLGYEIICMEDYTFLEQVEICTQTKVMVALHGAGLTNMMFMPKGGVVYEIRFEHDNINNCYFTLSSEFEHDYYYQLCSADGDNPDFHAGNVNINVEEFMHNIQRIEDSL